jgi:hypothetical protein
VLRECCRYVTNLLNLLWSLFQELAVRISSGWLIPEGQDGKTILPLNMDCFADLIFDSYVHNILPGNGKLLICFFDKDVH